jgi:hypothetical protein
MPGFHRPRRLMLTPVSADRLGCGTEQPYRTCITYSSKGDLMKGIVG